MCSDTAGGIVILDTKVHKTNCLHQTEYTERLSDAFPISHYILQFLPATHHTEYPAQQPIIPSFQTS